MEWLDKRLYSTEEEQDAWSTEEWRYFWAQLMKVLTEFVDTVTEERINNAEDEKKRRVLRWRSDKHKDSEEDVKTWDLDKMTYNVKRLIKAQLMQSKRYEYSIENYDNLRPLKDLPISDEVLDITCNGASFDSFECYKELNIKL